MIISLDFETRSEADLEEVGAYLYAIHPTTQVLCLAYDLNDGKGLRIWKHIQPNGKRVAAPKELTSLKPGSFILKAQNAEFEFNIWNYNCVKRHGFPPIKVEQLDCSAAQAAALALPRSLQGLGEALNAGVLKDLGGKKNMLKMSKPRRPTKNDPSKWVEDPASFEKLWAYNLDDVRAEVSASEKMPKLSPDALKLYHFTTKINDRGIYCDVELCKIAIRFAEIYSQKIVAELPKLTGGKISTANQHARIKAFLKEEGLELPDTQAGTVDLALKRDDLTPKARRLLEIRQALGKSSLAKYQAMVNMTGPDKRIRGSLLYHGASTGRLSGRGLQIQNFPARAPYKDAETILKCLAMNDYEFFKDLYPNVFGALSAALRGMLRAAPGKTLIAADFASIEVRVLFFLTRCELGLELYRKGVDLYVDMAQDVYNVKDPKAISKDQRFLGKEIILGSGFGLGPDKFMESCQKKNIQVTPALAKSSIASYREKFHEVPQFWRDLEHAGKEAVRTGKCIRVGYLQFLCKDGFLYIRLPSGRRLAYYAPQVNTKETKFGPKATLSYMAVHPKTRQWVREFTYGGKLCVGEGTLVLTKKGWVKIEKVNPQEKVWDGLDWVKTEGNIYNGEIGTIQAYGAWFTPDHLILTNKGWKNASSCKGYNRATCRLPNGYKIPWFEWQKIVVGSFMRLWNCRYTSGYGNGKTEEQGDFSFLRVRTKKFNREEKFNTWYDQASSFFRMAFNERSLQAQHAPRLEKLRRTWNFGMREMAKIFSKFLGGYGSYLCSGFVHRSYKQRGKLYSKKLPMDYCQNSGEQQTKVKKVYDLINCGPRNRFTVWAGGAPLIVHNCENVTQAVAADVMTTAMFRVEDAGYPVIMSIHDEIVSEIPKGACTVGEYEKLMSIVPKWAKGLPVKSEGWVNPRYKK